MEKIIEEMVRHHLPMGTPKTATDQEGIVEFMLGVRERLGKGEDPSYSVEPAVQGTEVDLVYHGGRLVRASTRGDGHMGEEVTQNIRTILNVPLTLLEWSRGRPLPRFLEVRAVVYMEPEALETLNRQRVIKGHSPYHSVQEATADSLSQADLKVTAIRPLEIFCHEAGLLSGCRVEGHYETMLILQEWGMRVARPYLKLCRTPQEVLEHCNHLKDIGHHLPFTSPGALVRVDRLEYQAFLGEKSGQRQWDLFYEFEKR